MLAAQERIVTDANKTTVPTTLIEGKPNEYPAFDAVEIAKDIEIGYGICPADVNGDGKLDVVVADAQQFWWFENPTWKKHALTTKGATRAHNVAIAPGDLDGDGKVDFAAGADWQINNTKSGGDVLWLRRGADVYQPWDVIPVAQEPTTHRVALADIDGDGKQEIINVPLLGKNSTKAKNWMDAPIRVLAYKPPKDPAKEPWKEVVLNESLHVAHGFDVVKWPHVLAREQLVGSILVSSYNGIQIVTPGSGSPWISPRLGEGNQIGADNALTKPNPSLGAGEVRLGRLAGNKRCIATIEPWHGHQAIAYLETKEGELWHRHVIDDSGMWGHGLACAKISSKDFDDIIVGYRDASKDRGKPAIAAYVPLAADGSKWRKHILDEGVAVEALCVADFNGDGKLDIAAAGRATHNVKLLIQK